MGAPSWVVKGSMTESMYEFGFLFVWGALMWGLLHYRRLDYREGTKGSAVFRGKRTWLNILLGATTGAAMYTGTAGFNIWYPGRLYVGLAAYFFFIAYNASASLTELHAMTKDQKNYPGFTRSKFFRRQMQMHVGMGFLGALLAGLSTCPQVSETVQLLRFACIVSFLGGIYQQLSLKSLTKNDSSSGDATTNDDDHVVEMDDTNDVYYSMG